MKGKVLISGIQMAPSEDIDANIKKASGLIGLASEKGAMIAVLPQLFNHRWFPSVIDTSAQKLAEAEDGSTITAMRETALKEKLVIVAPIFEEDSGERFNTAFVIGSNGEILGKYRKIHVPQIPLWEERSYFKPGDLGFPVIETPFCSIGVQLCWDVFFPEGARVLALEGAEIILAPTASAFYHSRAKWERAISASAHANGVFIFRANRIGTEKKQEFYGGSFCVGPDGEFIVEPAGSGAGIILAECDPSVLNRVRNEWVFLKDRRPECYGRLLS